MILQRLNLKFFRFIFFTFILFFSAFSSFVFAVEDESNSSVLQSVRDGMWDLAVKVYLYESVLFNPSDYFDITSLVSNSENLSVVSSTGKFNVSSGVVWSVPVGPITDFDNLNFVPAQLFDITFVLVCRFNINV